MVIRIRRKSIRNIYLTLFLFILIFSPPIIKKPHLVLAMYSLVMVGLEYKNKYNEILKKSYMLKWLVGMFVFFVFVITTTFINIVFCDDVVQLEHYSSLYNRLLVLIITIVPCCIYLCAYLERYHYSWEEFVRQVINAALIETILTYCSFFFPSIKNIFLYLMGHNSESGLYDNTWYTTIRSYGFAGTLVDIFGWGMGIIAGVSFFYGIIKYKRYIIYSIGIALAGALSARTALLMYVLGIVLTLLYLIVHGKVKLQLKMVFGIFLIGIILTNVLPLIMEKNSNTYNWMYSGVESLLQVLSGEEATSDFGSILFKAEWWQLPDLLHFFIGTGHSRYGASGYSHTDVGYVNDIWFVGLLGVTILYLNVGKVFQIFYKKSKSDFGKFIVLYFGVSMLVFNVKAGAIGYNIGAAVIFTVLFVSCYILNKDIARNENT